MASHHFGTRVFNRSERYDRMKENCRLSDLGLFQFIFCPSKHDISNPESENFIGLFKKLFSESALFVMILSHSGKLGTLARKYKCMLHPINLSCAKIKK